MRALSLKLLKWPDYTASNKLNDNSKAGRSDILETPRIAASPLHNGVLILPNYRLVHTSWNRECYRRWHLVSTRWVLSLHSAEPCVQCEPQNCGWNGVEPIQSLPIRRYCCCPDAPDFSSSSDSVGPKCQSSTGLFLSRAQVPRAVMCHNSWGTLFKFYPTWIALKGLAMGQLCWSPTCCLFWGPEWE